MSEGNGSGDERRRRRAPKPLTKERAWNYLLWLLGRRSYTVAELRERLQRRGLDLADAEPLLERLKELSLVNDELYAESYVRSRKASRGKFAIRRELRRKGITDALIEGELEGLTESQQLRAAARLLERNAWRYAPSEASRQAERAAVTTDDEGFLRRQELLRARARAFAFLARRGFSAAAASGALEEVGWFEEE